VSVNEVALSGTAHDLRDLRFTPAGIPVLEFSMRHSSLQVEAGHERRVELDMPTIAFGALAQRMAHDAPNGPIMARGFLARRSLRSTHVVLHARDIEYQRGE
jgi:primosomal replication protein N